MTLSKYKSKRDFKNTPEPFSGKGKKGSLRTFIVQKHDARRLHYDFRLEMEGVLKSWAVPKGPSMVAGEKRLAIMVEDHPLSYGEFSGEIPKGNYGAGMVEIWDNGVYAPLDKKEGDEEKNLVEQLNKGNLKFILEGTHLKGSFALVRLKNEDKNEWLLIKKEDEFSTNKFNIEKIEPIISTPENRLKGTGTDRKKTKSTKADSYETAFPSEAPEPMLAKLSNQVIDKPSWIYEKKYDGYRMISTINKGDVNLISRNGNSFNNKYNILAAELARVKDKVILDGELVIENNKGLSDFQLLQNYQTTQKGTLKYYVFDILYLNGQNIENFPLTDRKELLQAFFNKYKLKNVYNSEYQTGNGKALFEELSSRGYEGIIAKAPDSIYHPGKRSDSWLKVKASKMVEAVICGYTLPQNSRKYFGSLILGIYDGAELRYIGNCGTGFTDISLKELHSAFETLKTQDSPFVHTPKLSYTKGKPVWLKPELVCNVKFLEWSNERHLRNPVFMGLREDKDTTQVVMENNVEMNERKNEKKNDKKPENEKTLSFSGKKVTCTNLNKIYWPDEGYTKGDLIDYYNSISKFILPHLKDRPQSLNRHPNGIKGKSFYHKNMTVEQLPEWGKTAPIYSKSNDAPIDYLLCNDVATLIYMANLGCIEINPWHSKHTDPDKPTYMMLDLDPGDISFKDVVDTALVIKEICDEIAVPCYCKTSGATGLHIYLPLASKYNYDQVKTFAEIMAGLTHQRLPGTTSIERSIVKRKDKIYVDFLQNRKGQTIAAPYSVRPRSMAPVSTPLEWKEVNHSLSPEMFTIKNTLKRLNSKGDIWQPVLKETLNLKKALEAIEKLE